MKLPQSSDRASSQGGAMAAGDSTSRAIVRRKRGADVRLGGVILAAGVLVLGAAGLLFHEAGAIEQRLRDREVDRVGLLAYVMRGQLQSVASDLRILADGDGLRSYLAGGRADDRARAIRRAVFFSQLRPEYDQVRFLDENGREVWRINRGGQLVPEDQLQDKGTRPYFQQTKALGPGQIYISAFDLNVENGVVERPFKPMLRYATPIIDAGGRFRGIYIINYLGENLLERAAGVAPAYARRLRVLNAQGYWLKAGDPAQEWGFMLPERGEFTVAREDRVLADHLAREAAGQLRSGGGLFTWKRVSPREFASEVPGAVAAGDPYLIVASQVTAAEWAALFNGFREIALIGGSAVLVLAGVGGWFFRARQRALGELRRSEESLAVTMRSIGDAVLATDTAGRITLLNPVAEELTGWKLAEARGRPVAEVFNIINEETHAPAPIPVAEVLATGEIRALANHTALIARDGRQRAIEDSAAPIRGENGRLLGVVLVFRDVTASRRAQVELEKFFRLSVDCLCIAGPDGHFTRVSPGITGILGWSVEEFLATPYLDLVHPDDRRATEAAVERQIRQGEAVLHFENRYRHRDGCWRVISWRSVPDPQTGMMYGTARDVTERKQAEDRIRELNAELRGLFESLPGLYLVLSPRYDIVAASDAYLKATMTAREAIVGRNLFEVFPDNPDDPKADGVRNLRASLERVAQTRAPDTMPIQKYDVRRPDGLFEERYWSPINSPLLGPDRAVRYIIHRVEDVTDFVRRQDGAGRNGNGADLQARLQQMEAEIFASSQRVQAANDQLHLANKELEAFSYSVSHDLRAPLRHIQGYVEMLTREVQAQLTPKAQRYLKTIADAGREMGELIDDLLAFSRMGRAEMAEDELDLAPIIEEVRRGLELATRDRDIRWTIGPLPRVRGDAAMLRQVLANLIGNAVKYSRKRGTAEIAIGCAGEEEGRAVFFVRDNGAGFDMKYADKLFGVFQRLHRADEFEGTGIGLASVRRIVARHGGRTWAESKLDAGATFYFSLQPATPVPVQT